jgi:hypothetical protein
MRRCKKNPAYGWVINHLVDGRAQGGEARGFRPTQFYTLMQINVSNIHLRAVVLFGTELPGGLFGKDAK